jgi:hypothetical protein
MRDVYLREKQILPKRWVFAKQTMWAYYYRLSKDGAQEISLATS